MTPEQEERFLESLDEIANALTSLSEIMWEIRNAIDRVVVARETISDEEPPVWFVRTGKR
jgi:anion-transporting  ArsA/GET3 family ATPase